MTAGTYIALAISSLTIGYWIGVGKNLISYNQRAKDLAEEDEEEEDDEDLTDEKTAKSMNALKAGLLEECKMVSFIRRQAYRSRSTQSIHY
jgi:peptidyl-tRNA hydrolase, PTH2 family